MQKWKFFELFGVNSKLTYLHECLCRIFLYVVTLPSAHGVFQLSTESTLVYENRFGAGGVSGQCYVGAVVVQDTALAWTELG